jgi:shikimate dehydrogenase
MLKLGLIGYPLQQSLSPRLHNAAFKAMGLEGDYHLYPVPPLPEGASRLGQFVDFVRTGAMDGLNVTLPHKQSIVGLLDNLTPSAHAIGAVNTIFRQQGKALGDNTDAPGFLADMEAKMGINSVSQRSMLEGGASFAALVIGAGGAARAVVFALWNAGWQIYLTARRPEQAQKLISDFQGLPKAMALCRIRYVSMNPDSLGKFVSSIQGQSLRIIINATPVGMIPDIESCPWPESIPFPKTVFIYDLINKPPETMLNRRARRSGLATCNGHGMLVEQAALSLELWTGLPVPRQPMYEAVAEFTARNDPFSYSS